MSMGDRESDEESWGQQSNQGGAPAAHVDDAPAAAEPPLPHRRGRGRGRGRPRKNRGPPPIALARASAPPAGPADLDEVGIVALAAPLDTANADCSVSVGARLRLRRGGAYEPPPLASPMMHAFFASQRPDRAADAAMAIVAAAELCDSASVPMMSARVASQLRGISEDVHSDRLELLASCCSQLQRSLHWFLEVSLLKRLQPDNRLMYVEISTYDETPMKVKSSGAPCDALAPAGHMVFSQASLQSLGRVGTPSAYGPHLSARSPRHRAAARRYCNTTTVSGCCWRSKAIFSR